jgi:Tetracyclin repressor-like, C-terminal domain
MVVKMIAGCREFRAWTLEHVPEFSMIFGSPLPGLEYLHEMVRDPTVDCGYQFGQVFLDLFGELYQRRPFSIPADDEIQPGLRDQLARYRELTNTDLPLGALQTFLRCWVLLYGTVSLEVFGHLKFALDDASPMFELMLADLAPMIGLEYPLPERVR